MSYYRDTLFRRRMIQHQTFAIQSATQVLRIYVTSTGCKALSWDIFYSFCWEEGEGGDNEKEIGSGQC
jgi:hypothetical protein